VITPTCTCFGSFEVVDFHLRTGRYLLPEDSYQGDIWARPKAASLGEPRKPAAKARYTDEQYEAVLAAVTEYHPGQQIYVTY
jgi:hypothetical protein